MFSLNFTVVSMFTTRSCVAELAQHNEQWWVWSIVFIHSTSQATSETNDTERQMLMKPFLYFYEISQKCSGIFNNLDVLTMCLVRITTTAQVWQNKKTCSKRNN